ncbi:hypothetical protein V8E55_006443 [Tylopilus felleus]
MAPRPGTRRAQPSTTCPGLQFSSPKRPRDKRQTQRLIAIPGQSAEREKLLKRLQALRNGTSAVDTAPPDATTDFEGDTRTAPEPDGDVSFDLDFDPSMPHPHLGEDDVAPEPDPEVPPPKRMGRINPDATAERLYHQWQSLLPRLVTSYANYHSRTLSKPLGPLPHTMSLCTQPTCDRKRTVLVHFGVFPTAPSQPRMAISLDLLGLYRALFERSCDAINALAAALNTHYTRRGFLMVNKKGDTLQDPFRRSLAMAVQWYDVLQVEVEKHIENVIKSCRDRVYTSKSHSPLTSESASEPPRQPLELPSNPPCSSALSPGKWASILVQRCPACFGGTQFGRPLAKGGDIHVAMDGNFHHRHRRSAGDCPSFYDPVYFLPKEEVDSMGEHIQKQCKKPVRAYRRIVPDEAIDSCETSYEAADGNKQKAAMDSFDDTGIMALICRHDIPLFFANIDTPGEQQKFALALVRHIFTLLPSNATIVGFYDIGCVTARTVSKYDILGADIMQRLRFATTAMHAYGHEWACQLVYNPGTERLWPRLIKLIGIERASSRKRRVWLIDCCAAAIGHEIRADLGDWIKRHLRRGVDHQGHAAREQVENSNHTVKKLQEQWALQKELQLSIRAYAPARLKKQLDTVISLQSDLDATEKALQAARNTIEKDPVASESITVFDGLERTYDCLMSKVDALYASLNVQDQFPELDGIDFDFVQTLLLVRDLKINIRKRAVGSFFEWDKLDQAVDMKLHQQTRKAIAKCQPALMSAIRKFNTYCEHLAELHDPSWSIPVPNPLLTKLAELRADQTLMEDVWITPSVGAVPLWIADQDVRNGIRGMLKGDRCLEEQRCLGLEADNLCHWYGDELAALELSLLSPENEDFALFLQQHRDHMLSLRSCWTSPLVSAARFESRTTEAISLATSLARGTHQISLVWVEPIVLETSAIMLEEDTGVLMDSDIDPPEDKVNAMLVEYLQESPDPDEEDVDNEPWLDNLHATLIWKVPLSPISTRVRATQDGFPNLIFESADIELLKDPTTCLNDVCINGCIPLLFSAFLPDNRNSFADVWIIPIHRPGHWVLCIANLSCQEILLFDSLGAQNPWCADVQDIMMLIARLLGLAHRHHSDVQPVPSDWTARPLVVEALQTNNFDCGVWILAVIAATL